MNNNGQIAGYQFELTPSAPGIYVDPNGNLAPNPVVAQGSTAVLYVTGAGEVSVLLGRGDGSALTVAAGGTLPELPPWR